MISAGVWNAPLEAVIDFLRRRHVNPMLGAAFTDLLSAFDDLKKGREPPLFSLSTSDQACPGENEAWHERCLASASMEALMRSGMPKQEAAREVARQVRSWPRSRAMKRSGNTIASGRDQCSPNGSRHIPQYELIVNHLLAQADPPRGGPGAPSQPASRRPESKKPPLISRSVKVHDCRPFLTGVVHEHRASHRLYPP